MDDIETALAEARQEAPPDQDWDAFVAALYTRARAVGVPDEQVEAFLAHALAQPDPIGVLTAGSTDDLAYDESAWFAFLAEHGTAWDGLADSWDVFREWFAYTAGEHRLSVPAGQFLDGLTAADNRVAVMREYGIAVNPLAGFPLLDRLVTYPSTREGMWQFVLDSKGDA